MTLPYTFFIILFGLNCCYAESDEKILFRKDYTYIEELGAFYKEHKVKEEWNDALSICREEGAKMLIPRSRFELEKLDRFNMSNYWLAYQDIFSDGHFVAPDGRPEEEIYVNWAEGEPLSENESQHCVKYKYEDLTYIVDNCKGKLPFICKKNVSMIEKNNFCDTFDKNYRFSNVTESCYKFHSNAVNWNNAFRTCSNERANLVVINSQKEADLLVELFKKYPFESLKGSFNKNILHIGFADLLSTGTFKTINGRTLEDAGYDNWSNGYDGSAPQPDNTDNDEHCGSMFRDGTLNDINCDRRAMFICEKVLSKSELERISTIIKPKISNSFTLPDLELNKK